MKTTKILLSLGIFASLGMLGSCADDDLANNGNQQGDKGAVVTFNVSQAQDEAAQRTQPGMPVTRAAFANQLGMMNLMPEDLTTQKIAVEGGAPDLCLIESTTAGIDPMPRKVSEDSLASMATRANITDMASLNDFASYGYRGADAASISTAPEWFYHEKTKNDGTLYTQHLWSYAIPYGKFYAVYPWVEPTYNKLKFSPQTHAGTPYVDFEVEQDVTKQKDLMTACSGTVHYDTPNVAPETNLKFRHALTAVRFKVGQNLSYNKTISKIQIIGAKSKGRYTLPTSETGTDAGWSNVDAPKNFTLSGLSVSTTEAVNNIIVGNAGDNHTFYMIPQTLTGAHVIVKVFFSDGTSPITATLSGTWKPGTTKTYALSQNNSDWQYQLTVESPAVANYDATTANYTIASYRQAPNGVQQAVPWKVIGYDNDNDGNFDMSEKPAWLTGLSEYEGDGGTTAAPGTATLKTDIQDFLKERNDALKDAAHVGNAADYYDLSTKGGSEPRSTANSYVVSAPGYYKLPLVYGNAITGGLPNEHAYKTTVTGSYMLQNFTDHAGVNIDNPWITKSNGGANVPNVAKLVWADEAGLVSDPYIEGSGENAFLNFEVTEDNIKTGNAVIAVMKDNVVVWSWHIWIAPQDVLQTTACTNKTNHVYKFTNETLGWKYTKWLTTTYDKPRSVKVKVEQTFGQAVKQTGVITITQNNHKERQGNSTLYQWGRKDAFPGSDISPEGTPFTYDNLGDSPFISYFIQNPTGFYHRGLYLTNPSHISNLWSMDGPATFDFNDHPVVKTIYDPCPAGFKMPATNAFTGFSTTGTTVSEPAQFNVAGAWDNGWHFKAGGSSTETVYFPSAPMRHMDNAGLYNPDGGSYWSATLIMHDHGTGAGANRYSLAGGGMFFRQNGLWPQYHAWQTYGSSVRPVKDE